MLLIAHQLGHSVDATATVASGGIFFFTNAGFARCIVIGLSIVGALQWS